MPRPAFPFLDDRRVIEAWLHGRSAPRSEHLMVTEKHHLLYMSGDDSVQALGLFISETDRSLQAILQSGALAIHAYRVIDFITRLMDLPDTLIMARVGPVSEPQWQFAGSIVTPGQPFVIAGPITMMAFRAGSILTEDALEAV